MDGKDRGNDDVIVPSQHGIEKRQPLRIAQVRLLRCHFDNRLWSVGSTRPYFEMKTFALKVTLFPRDPEIGILNIRNPAKHADQVFRAHGPATGDEGQRKPDRKTCFQKLPPAGAAERTTFLEA